MKSFKAQFGARVRAAQNRLSGPYGALFAVVEKDYGAVCADALRLQVAPWIGAMSEETEPYGPLTLTLALDGQAPEIAGSAEINAILEGIAKRDGMDSALTAAADYDNRATNYMWPADVLAAWRPTLGVHVQGDGSMHIKCRDVVHLRQAHAAVKAAMRKGDFALNWRSAVSRAVQSLTAYDINP